MSQDVLHLKQVLSFFESPAFIVSGFKNKFKVVSFNGNFKKKINPKAEVVEGELVNDFLKQSLTFTNQLIILFIEELNQCFTSNTAHTSRTLSLSHQDQVFNFKFERLKIEGKPLILVVLDVVPSKQRLAKSSDQLEIEFFKQIFKSLPIGVAVNRIDDSQTIFTNEKMSEIYGWSIEDLNDVSTFFEKVYPDEKYRKQVSEMVLRDIQSGDPARMQWKKLSITTKAGEKKIVDAKNIPLYDKNLMISTVTDFTESYRIEEKLKKAKSRFNLAAQATSDAVWEWNLKEDTLFWSPGYERLFNYKLVNNTVTKAFWESKIHPSDFDPFFDSLHAALNDKAVSKWTFNYRFMNNEGEYANVRENVIIVRNIAGEAKRLVGALQDITKPLKRERHLDLLEKLVDGTKDAILVTKVTSNDFFDSEIVYANSSFQNLFEYDIPEVLGITPREFYLNSKTSPKFFDIEAELESWNSVDIDILSTTKTEIEFWNNVSISPVMDDQGWYTHWMIVNRNVNDLVTNSEKRELQAFTHQVFQGEETMENILCKVLLKIEDLVRSCVSEFWLVDYYSKELTKFLKMQEGELIDLDSEDESTRGKHLALEIFEDEASKLKVYDEENTSEYGEEVKLTYGFQIQSHGEPLGVVILGFKDAYSREGTLGTIFDEFSIQLANEISRKQTEQEMSTFFEFTPDFLCIAGKDGFLKKINKRASDILGYSQEEFLNTPFLEFITEEDHDNALALLAEARYNEGYHFQEIRIRSKDDKFLNVDWTVFSLDTSEEIFCVGTDVTEYTANLKDLKTQIEKFKIISKTVKDAVWDFDFKSKKITWGLGLTKLFGYDPENFGQAEELWLDKVHPGDRERAYGSFKKSLENLEEDDWKYEYRFKKYDGSYANVLDRGTIIRDETGKPQRMVGTMQDITEYRAYQKKLEALNEQLIKQAKSLTKSNKDLEEFAYIASHDLQEPLRMITGFLTRLEDKYGEELDEKANEYIAYAVDGAKRMRQIIHGLLDFSKVGRKDLAMSKVNVASIIDEVKLLLSSAIEENNATIETGDLPKRIYSVEVELKEVFLNLIENSIKYSKKGEKAHIKIDYKETKQHHIFWVSDNGIGISEEYFDKIFGIFQRLHGQSEYSGTGIGLAIVKKIISNLGGSISLESKLGEGTKFLIQLPNKSKKQ